MYVQPLEGSLSPNTLASPVGTAEYEGAPSQGGSVAPAAGDNISRFVPPWQNEGAGPLPYGGGYGNSGSLQGLFGPLMGLLQQLMQTLQSMMGYGGGNCPPYGGAGCPPYGGGNCPPYGNERYFQNANGGSVGDPHLSFNGEKWNNMASHPDLLNSDSFAGGFQISTQATPPNAKGVTWNQSATVSLNNGATTISMNNDGQASVSSYGQSLAIGRGQTLQLGDGESVTYEENGSLRINAQNGEGGRIETTLSPEEKGVNVDVTAHDVDLGGYLVRGYEGQPVPTPIPGPPYNGPVPTPIPGPPYNGPVPTPIPGPPFSVPEPVGPQPMY
ncbi:MAG: hypothetical protein JO104_08725 [Candidatus Eremiobacteraeota bacterium]|nr:hypothetical protein [Candidatus Eremiobacteraeota bacterium]